MTYWKKVSRFFMIFMLDQYDSFVHNLAAYLREEGETVVVRRADGVSIEEIAALQPKGIILSPGPKRPADATEGHRVLQVFQNQIPILGVCLGHQIIGQALGAVVSKGERPMHGKLSTLTHNGTGVFAGLPESFTVTRYHSLMVEESTLPSCLSVTAKSDDGVIMGIAHRTMPIYGVQFHPEAVLTQHGHALLQNFASICEEWREHHGKNCNL